MKPCKKCGSTDRGSNGNCRPCNNEYARQWRLKNKERVRLYNKTRNAGWNKKNNRRRATKWRKENPANTHNKRAISLGIEGTFSNTEWKSILKKYGNKCVKCGISGEVTTITVDHIISFKDGGTNYIDNIQPLCKNCNSQKQAKSIDYRPDIKKEIDQLSLW